MQKVSATNISIDERIFKFINAFAGRWKFLDFLAIFFADYLEYVLAAFLIIVSYKTRNIYIFLVPGAAALLARFGINETIYFFYKRKRPVEQIPATLLITKPNHPAFPSSHAALFFAASFSLFFFSAHLAVLFLIASCLISLARIFCGVHWPSDIVAGFFVGLVLFAIFWGIKVML